MNKESAQLAKKAAEEVEQSSGSVNFCVVHANIDNLRNGLETQAKVYATSVIRFTLEPCKFTLNTFQDFVFTYFKQEQKCEWNYRLLKLLRGINKAENHHLMFP